MKKKGFGTGKWNGFGGKVEEGETIEEAAAREVREEAGIMPVDLEKRGIIEFDFKDGSRNVEVHIFKCAEFDGEPAESDEMTVQWFALDEIPFKNMWSADAYWLPLFLKGMKFKGSFLYDAPSGPDTVSAILDRKIEEVREL